jgi:hypothetical protein
MSSPFFPKSSDMETLTRIFFSFLEVDWYEARSWCAERGMRQATIKAMDEIKRAKHELNRLEFGKK